MVSQKGALRQLNRLKMLGKDLRLAADGWPSKWQTLIATLMSARTTDKKTIPIAQELFQKYSSIEKLARASEKQIGLIIRPVNFYKTKSKHIKKLSQILAKEYKGEAPMDFSKLIELPGVGRKTANVFLAEQNHDTIGVDTHLTWLSQQLGWTKHKEQKKIEDDLKSLFPRRFWGDLNWILVRFGQTYPSRKKKLEILKGIKKIH